MIDPKRGLSAVGDVDTMIAGYPFLARVLESCPRCRTAVVQVSRRRHFEADDTVVSQGSIYPGLFILAEGAAKVVVQGGTPGVQAIVSILKEVGSIYGLAATLTGDATTSALVTMAPSEFLFLDKDTFQAMLKEHPEISLEVAKQLAGEIQEARRWLASAL